MLNWIVLNRTVYIYEKGFGIKWPKIVDKPKKKKNKQKKNNQ